MVSIEPAMSLKSDRDIPSEEPGTLDITEELASRPGFILCLSTLIVSRPRTYFWAFMGVLLCLAGVGGGTLKPNEDQNAGWTITDDSRAERFDMIYISKENAAQVLTRNTEWVGGNIYIMLDWEDGSTASIFTPSALQHLCNLENTVQEVLLATRCDSERAGVRRRELGQVLPNFRESEHRVR